MSKSVLLKSSLAKKYWMALTGLFLCLFLVGHLLGNLQLIMLWKSAEEVKRSFNEYAYFMQHNPFIKVLSYLTYLSIIFHAIDGYLLAVQNKKARPVSYAANKPSANSSSASRNMAVLGTVILVFIVTHMANFWAKMHFTDMPLHTTKQEVMLPASQNPLTGEIMEAAFDMTYYLNTKGEYVEYSIQHKETGKFVDFEKQSLSDKPVGKFDIKDETFFVDKKTHLKLGEGYKDLYSTTAAFFGHNIEGFETNKYALIAVIAYVISMIVLGFHLSHGFASAFQSLGMRHPKYTKAISFVGQFVFAVLIPLSFAIIPVLLYLTK